MYETICFQGYDKAGNIAKGVYGQDWTRKGDKEVKQNT